MATLPQLIEEDIERLDYELEVAAVMLQTTPAELDIRDGHVTGLRCLKARMVAQAGSKRMAPVPIEGSEFMIRADAVISAIGQRIEKQTLDELKDLAWTRRDTIQVHKRGKSIPEVIEIEQDAATRTRSDQFVGPRSKKFAASHRPG